MSRSYKYWSLQPLRSHSRQVERWEHKTRATEQIKSLRSFSAAFSAGNYQPQTGLLLWTLGRRAIFRIRLLRADKWAVTTSVKTGRGADKTDTCTLWAGTRLLFRRRCLKVLLLLRTVCAPIPKNSAGQYAHAAGVETAWSREEGKTHLITKEWRCLFVCGLCYSWFHPLHYPTRK